MNYRFEFLERTLGCGKLLIGTISKDGLTYGINGVRINVADLADAAEQRPNDGFIESLVQQINQTLPLEKIDVNTKVLFWFDDLDSEASENFHQSSAYQLIVGRIESNLSALTAKLYLCSCVDSEFSRDLVGEVEMGSSVEWIYN